MWSYDKRLIHPVKVKKPDPMSASIIITQLGGPHGELGAATRYLQQRYSMPCGELIGILTDIGTEELAHIEMISALVYQLTRNLTEEEIKAKGFAPYFVDHTTGIYPQAASGVPFSAGGLSVSGDTFADLHEDMAAEQKARLSYDNILRLVDDPDVKDAIRFLRAREIVHFQRFGEANREDCSKIPKARKTHKFSTFGKSLSIRTFAGHRHKPPYLLLYLKMKIIHEIGQAAFSYN